MIDQVWEKTHSERDWGKYPNEDVVRFVARNFYKSQNRQAVKILDLGCGGGAHTWFLAREGFDAYALDGAKTAIEKAKRYLDTEGLSANYCVGDAANLTYSDNAFDAIVESAMLYANRVADIKLILNEAFRVLKPSGQLLSVGLFTTNMTGYGTGVEVEPNTYHNVTIGRAKDLGTTHFFTRQEVEQLFCEAGFSIVSIDLVRRSEDGGKTIVESFNVQAKKQN